MVSQPRTNVVRERNRLRQMFAQLIRARDYLMSVSELQIPVRPTRRLAVIQSALLVVHGRQRDHVQERRRHAPHMAQALHVLLPQRDVHGQLAPPTAQVRFHIGIVIVSILRDINAPIHRTARETIVGLEEQDVIWLVQAKTVMQKSWRPVRRGTIRTFVMQERVVHGPQITLARALQAHVLRTARPIVLQ